MTSDDDNLEQRLLNDEVVHALASDLRSSGNPKTMYAHDGGTPRFGFMKAANDEYRRRGGIDGGHLAAIPTAVLRLAYDTPATRYTVRTLTEGLSPMYVVGAVTRIELGHRLLDITADTFGIYRHNVEIELRDTVAFAKNKRTGSEIAAFTIDSHPEAGDQA